MKRQEYKELREVLRLQLLSDQRIDLVLKYDTFVMIEGRFVTICDKKPTITKTFWYDDEGEAPEVNEEYFILMNIENNAPKLKTMQDKYGHELCIVPKYWNDNTEFKVGTLSYSNSRLGMDVPRANVDEKTFEIINEEIRIKREKYLKRLKSYWKRYNKNVTAMGYWTNR